jgi:hypothetical protein
MAKEWILNCVMNRFQLNFKRNVGAVAEEIRKCQPKTVDQWQEYYFRCVRTPEAIDELGRKLYVKISEVVPAEIEQITEQDCIEYMRNLVILRTFDGYTTEIQTVYGQLQNALEAQIEPASDEWDRLFNVDFFIKVNTSYIGLQIKPISNVSQITQIYKERSLQRSTHEKFTKKFGGKVFYIYSLKKGNTKVIQNPEVIEAIRDRKSVV